MAECVSSTVSKYKSSWGCANSFYYLSAVGGEKAIREFEVACHSLKLLVPDCMCSAFIKPPTTCLSCQWPHWLANSKFKPLPSFHLPACGQSLWRALKWEIPFRTHLAQRSRCTESLIFHYILYRAHVFSFLLLLSSYSGCSCPGPAHSLIVSVCIPFMPAQDKLDCVYEWKWKILLFGTQPAGTIQLLSQDARSILMEYLYQEMFSNFCFNYNK